MASRGASRITDPRERYRLYLDESGDHVFRHLDNPHRRYLCLMGCFFRGEDYQTFHNALQAFKQKHIPHSPDEPVILHREDILNRRGTFWRLREPTAAAAFDEGFMELIAGASFRMVAVVIDKKYMLDTFAESAGHPYHHGLGFMLQRYCGYLNHINRQGDVMAESRGGQEDRKLKDSYAWVYNRGAWMREAEFFQRALTSRELKVKPKKANIAGLQLADLLGHPVKQTILRERGLIDTPPTGFARRLLEVAKPKFNRHLYDGRIQGYGKVFYPRQ